MSLGGRLDVLQTAKKAYVQPRFQPGQETPASKNDLCAILNREGFAVALATNHKCGNDRRHQRGTNHLQRRRASPQKLHDNRGANGATERARHIPHYIIAKTGNLVRTPHQMQGMPRTHHLTRSHRMQRLLLRRRHRDSDDIEHYPDQNDTKQDRQ